MGAVGPTPHKMDLPELTKIISNRIQKLEPEHGLKILGYILLAEPTGQEMFQLAYCSDDILFLKINEAKNALNGLVERNNIAPSSAQALVDLPISSFANAGITYSRRFSSPAAFHDHRLYWDPQLASTDKQPSLTDLDFMPHPDAAQFLNLDEQLYPGNSTFSPNFSNNNDYYHQQLESGRITRRSSSLPEMPTKPCVYFYKGYCKHGSSCHYFHGETNADGNSQMLSSNSIDMLNEEHNISPSSLARLEMEVRELLKSKNGPISIASMPMLYYERYGRNLQADGYLTESQRHGRAGFSLTRLLARMKSIRVIDRPHGQHCVVLAEEAAKYMGFRHERHEINRSDASSHQIYLTFPAESTFNEEDVAKYFRQFGPVDDVRLPCQDPRMYGFVSFKHPENVTEILSMRNPHFICNARVLVKPYKEKLRSNDKVYIEKARPTTFVPHYLDTSPDCNALGNSRFINKNQLIEEQEKLSDLEQMRLSEFRFNQRMLNQEHFYHYNLENFKFNGLECFDESAFVDHFSRSLDALDGSGNNRNVNLKTNDIRDDESSNIELPESPFSIGKLSASSNTE